MSLKSKIHLYSTLLMFVVLILAVVIIYFLFQRMSYNTEYEQLLSRSKELTAALSSLETEEDAAMVLRAFVPSNGAIAIRDSSGKTIINVQSIDGLGKLPTNQSNSPYRIEDFQDQKVLILSIPIIWPTGEVVSMDMVQLLTDVVDNLQVLRFVLLGVTIFAMVPIILSSIALGKIVTQPIQKLIHAMNVSRKSGTYEKLTSFSKGNDELALMERTFNEMMEQLEQNYQKQEQFVSNASHELKTPLTVIESYSRLLQRRGFENREVVNEALNAITSETARMKQMITQMLEMAKSSENHILEISEVNVNELVESVVIPLRQAYNREFIIEGENPCIVETDARLIKQVLFILLDNARKYSEREIITTISYKEDFIEISVKDYGKGIPQEDLPHIFDRFYRVDSDRSRKTGGTGLGLAIAKELTERLGAELAIESVVEMGTLVRLTIPKKREDSQ